MSAKRLEEWLEAAVHGAAKDRTFDFDLTDAHRPLYLPDRGSADERHLDSLH